jgi:hypothetical protein
MDDDAAEATPWACDNDLANPVIRCHLIPAIHTVVDSCVMPETPDGSFLFLDDKQKEELAEIALAIAKDSL